MGLEQIDYRGLLNEENPLNLVGIKSTVSAFPLASKNDDKLAFLTAKDGSNLKGFYLSDGTNWVYQTFGTPLPAPTITNISYAPLVTNETKDIVITGTNFTASTTVSIAKGVNVITVNLVTFDSATQLTVNITTEAVTGGFDVTVNNGTATTLVDGITVSSATTTLIPGDGTTTWDNTSGVTTSLGKILPTSSSITWGRVGTFGTVPASTDFSLTNGLEYMSGQSSNGFLVWGIKSSAGAVGQNNMLFSFYFNGGSQVAIRENGSQVTIITNSASASDTFEIKRTGTTVEYYRNSTLAYTSLNTSSTDIDFSVDINRYIGIKDAQIVY